MANRFAEAINVLRGKASEASFPSEPGVDPDEHLWEELGIVPGLGRRRGLPTLTQAQMIRKAHHFYKGNPLAKRMVDIPAEYVVGDGITYVAEHQGVKEILDSHWNDPTNNWSITQFERVRDWGLVGELCFTTHVNPMNGHVVLGNIDVGLIERVIEDPDNSMKTYAIVLKKLRNESYRRIYKVIDVAGADAHDDVRGRWVGLPENDKQAKEFGFEFKKGDTVDTKHLRIQLRNLQWSGSCFFFTINNPMSSPRGWSDLLADLDWIDSHDQYLFSQVEKAIESAMYVWDVELKGMNESQQRAWLRAQNRMKPGQKFTHNENVKMEMKAPNLQLQDAAAMANVLKNHLLAGVGYPPIWFAESLVSRASAPEMTEPAFKHLGIRRRYTANMISRIFRFSIDQAVLHGRLLTDRRMRQDGITAKMSESFYLRMPDLSAKDQRALAIAIRNYSIALSNMMDKGALDVDEAKRLFSQYSDMTGLDAWRREPPTIRDQDAPDKQFDAGHIFQRSVESGEHEMTIGDYRYFVFPDPHRSSLERLNAGDDGVGENVHPASGQMMLKVLQEAREAISP